MPTNSQVAAKLLREAAGFFLEVGKQNPEVEREMLSNAKTFDTVAGLLEADPTGECLFAEPGTPKSN